MAQLAQDIHDEAAARIPAAPVTNPADLMDGPDLLAIFAKVEAAIAVLELLTRGARILRTPGVPDDLADGEDGDLAINLANTGLYAKDAGHWQGLFKLKGDKGDSVKGDNGLSAYGVALANGFVGTEPQWLASLGRAGNDGLSAYQVAKQQGFTGTVSQWLESLKVKGDTGQRGNVNRWESFAPTNEDGLVGDLWVHNISADKCAFYKCTTSVGGVGTWSLRYTSPDAPTTTTAPSAGVTTFNQRNGNVTLSAADLADLLVAGGTASITVVGGKVQITAVAGDSLPAQSAATAGKVLKSNGTAASWQEDKEGTAAPVYDDTAVKNRLTVVEAAVVLAPFRALQAQTEMVWNRTNKLTDNVIVTLDNTTNGTITYSTANTPNGFEGRLQVYNNDTVARAFIFPNANTLIKPTGRANSVSIPVGQVLTAAMSYDGSKEIIVYAL